MQKLLSRALAYVKTHPAQVAKAINVGASKAVGLLPASLQPYAKAVVPLVANLVYAGVTLVATGGYDAADLRANLIGLVGVALTFTLPNKATPALPVPASK